MKQRRLEDGNATACEIVPLQPKPPRVLAIGPDGALHELSQDKVMIVGVIPMDGHQRLVFRAAGQRLEIVLNNDQAEWLGAVLANHFKLFHRRNLSGKPAATP